MPSTSYLDLSQSEIFKQCASIGSKDCISLLPDDVLSHILTRLTLKDAMATSILSRRWKSLWTSHPVLDFGCFNCCQFDLYVQRVGNILRQYNGPKLHKFRIVNPMYSDNGRCIDDWISFAFRNGASEIVLDFKRLLNKYYMPTSVFSFPSTSPNFVKHFVSLRILSLRYVNLTNEAFDQILSCCVSLENFLIHYSVGLVQAKNKVPHMKLKSLELYYCGDLEKFEVLAPNLVSFKYQGLERTLCIKDSQNLTSLHLITLIGPVHDTSLNFPSRKDFIFSQFSYLHKLEHLHLSVHLLEDMNNFTKLCVFSNLKHLMLDVIGPSWNRFCYQVAAFLLRVSPYIEQLEMNVKAFAFYKHFEMQPLELASMSPHQNLKKIKLFGFIGGADTIEFLTYLHRHAVSLQKIDVTARHAVWYGDKLDVRNLYLEKKEAKICKKRVVELQQTLRQNVRLLFHDYEQCLECIGDDDDYCYID